MLSADEPAPGNGQATSESEDEIIFTGTGVILAMAIGFDDSLVFTMNNALAETGGVFTLKTAPESEKESAADSEFGFGNGSESDNDATTALGGLLYDYSHTTPLPGTSTSTAGGDTGPEDVIELATGLGPFLPGIATCPVTGDIYVARGHTGLTRVVRGADGNFANKVRRLLI